MSAILWGEFCNRRTQMIARVGSNLFGLVDLKSPLELLSAPSDQVISGSSRQVLSTPSIPLRTKEGNLKLQVP
jgi:hypothetical protein